MFVLDFSWVMLMATIAGIGRVSGRMTDLTLNRLAFILVSEREGVIFQGGL